MPILDCGVGGVSKAQPDCAARGVRTRKASIHAPMDEGAAGVVVGVGELEGLLVEVLLAAVLVSRVDVEEARVEVARVEVDEAAAFCLAVVAAGTSSSSSSSSSQSSSASVSLSVAAPATA